MSAPISEQADASAHDLQDDLQKKGITPKKGRPTPRRNEVERAKGVRHDPSRPAQTPAERKAQRKALKASMTREQWKAHKAKEKEARTKAQRAARAAIDRGDERYLLERDKGPAKAFIRDWVDGRVFFSTLMLPIAVVLLLFMIIGNKFPVVSAYVSLFGMVAVLIFFLEGVWIGSRAASQAKKEVPTCTDSRLSLGFYAYARASQPRRLRTPKPRVSVGKNERKTS